MFPLPELEGAWTFDPRFDVWFVDVRLFDVSIAKERVLLALAAAGAAAAFGGAAWFSSRFFAAQRRILLAAKESDCQGLSKEDTTARDSVYRAQAAAEVAPSLHALELRSYRLARMARALPKEDPRKRSWEEEAKRLFEAVDEAIHWAAVAILERRSATAFSGKGTRSALAFAIAGIILVFGLADYAKGQRDLIELRATCQAAVTKGATDACDSVRDSKTVGALKKAADDKQKAAKDALDRLRGGLPLDEQGRLQRLEACTTLLSTHDALSGDDAVVKAAIVRACDNLVQTSDFGREP